jgi:hypothetical protein
MIPAQFFNEFMKCTTQTNANKRQRQRGESFNWNAISQRLKSRVIWIFLMSEGCPHCYTKIWNFNDDTSIRSKHQLLTMQNLRNGNSHHTDTVDKPTRSNCMGFSSFYIIILNVHKYNIAGQDSSCQFSLSERHNTKNICIFIYLFIYLFTRTFRPTITAIIR